METVKCAYALHLSPASSQQTWRRIQQGSFRCCWRSLFHEFLVTNASLRLVAGGAEGERGGVERGRAGMLGGGAW